MKKHDSHKHDSHHHPSPSPPTFYRIKAGIWKLIKTCFFKVLSVNIEYTTMRHVRVIALSFDDDHGATVAVDNYDIC